MTHFQGTQDEQLLATAEFIVRNPDMFQDGVTRWSQSFINGGISDGTMTTLLAREGIDPIPLGQTEVPLEQVITHNSDGQSSLTTQQLIQLGQSQSEISEALQREADLREQQREDDLNQVEQMNARFSQQLVDLGKSVQDASQAATSGGIASFASGIGTGGLIALGAVVFIMLRSK